MTLEIHDSKNLSAAKGESFHDTIKTFESYSDGLIIRHPMPGSVANAADIANIPVINAGDGVGEHPTQALLDLYTINKHHGRLDTLKVVIGGDLRNGRTVHSLLRGLAMYRANEAVLLTAPELQLEREFVNDLQNKGMKITTIESEEDIPHDAHVWYWTRVQKERFVKIDEYEKVKNRFVVTHDLFKSRARKDTILMHPLPRVGEISEELDADSQAVYFEQMRNGLFVRMALLNSLFN
jgi:aspartate carbamoyltransferase